MKIGLGNSEFIDFFNKKNDDESIIFTLFPHYLSEM